MNKSPFVLLILGFTVLLANGCSDSSAPQPTTPDASQTDTANAEPATDTNSETETPEAETPRRVRGPISLSAADPNESNSGENAKVEPDPDAVLDKMQPLQIMLGKWRGTTRKTFGMFKAVDQLEWLWDFQSDPNQPSLVITSDASPYLRSGRITYSLQDKKFMFSTEDKDGLKREFLGEFTQDPADEPGDDDKLQRTYMLEFTEVERKDTEPRWQIVFNQQENNRYLMELSRARSSGRFNKLDTVGTQRDGTSFAINLEDYKEMTCVVSQGKGTIQVSFKGKTYWVCCTGCKAAFDDEPEKWLAKMQERASAR